MKRPLLLAEDDRAIVQVVTEILEMEGYSVIQAATEKEVLTLATTKDPFVVFLDISLSGSDGRKIARKLRASEKTNKLPLVIVSADAKVKEIAKEIQADGYLVKPFDIETLLDIVRQYASL